MRTLTVSICACGAVSIGRRHNAIMKFHQKIMMSTKLLNDEAMLFRASLNTRFFEGKIHTSEDMGIAHVYTAYRAGNQNQFIPLDYEGLAFVDLYSRWLYPNGEFQVIRDATTRIAECVNRTSYSDDPWPQYAICLTCDFKVEGKGAANLGSWHACEARHKVAYSATKFTKTITLVPVPVRRAITYHKNHRMQMRMPCDIDPYKHPAFKYSRIDRNIVAAYKAHVRMHAVPGTMYVDPPWQDPYKEQYKEMFNNGLV